MIKDWKNSTMRITRILCFLVAFITASGFYSLYNYLNEDLEKQTFQATEEAMVDTAHLLTALVECQLDGNQIEMSNLDEALKQADTHKFKASIFKHNKEHVGTHAYITDKKGIVIFDSHTPERVGKDLSEFNDVFLALQDKYAVRSSRNDEDDAASSILYVAVPIKNREGEIIGVLSAYKAQKDVLHFIEARRRWIIFSLFLIGIGIGVFIIAVFIWLFRPLGKLTAYANAISRGERPTFPKIGQGREVNTLGKALRDMRESLEGRRYTENYTRMLTHELKSPLAAIKGAAELLNEDMPREQREKFLANICRQADRSTNLIDGLLRLSQLEAQQELSKPTTINLSEITNEVCDEYEARTSAKSLTIARHIPENLTISGDSNMLATAVANLIENAIRFSPEGGTITISLLEESNKTKILVRDQGPGIPDFAKERVFEHFYSLPCEETKQKGTGLGLSFVLEVAKLHNGAASLENSASGGAIATITLPH
ncbi:two-component system sensor histidine kinase CreC [Rubritalea halochordaticola]